MSNKYGSTDSITGYITNVSNENKKKKISSNLPC